MAAPDDDDGKKEESMDAQHWFDGYFKIQLVPGTRLYIADYDGAQDDNEIAKHEISHVVSLTTSEMAHLDGIEYLQLKIHDDDTTKITPHFTTVFAFVDEALSDADAHVLIHCDSGMSRSASFLIAYLMTANRLSFRRAFDLVKRARSIIASNSAFLAELKVYEASLALASDDNDDTQAPG